VKARRETVGETVGHATMMRLQRLTLAALALLSSTHAQRNEIPQHLSPAEKQALLDKGYNPDGVHKEKIEAIARKTRAMDQHSQEFLNTYEEKVALFTDTLISFRKQRLAQLPPGTANRSGVTPLGITLWADARLQALFNIRRYTIHDPEINSIHPEENEENVGFMPSELRVMEELGIQPYWEDAFTLVSGRMKYRQYFHPEDDMPLGGMLWLGAARDPSLVYKGEIKVSEVLGADGESHWVTSEASNTTRLKVSSKQSEQPKKRRQHERVSLSDNKGDYGSENLLGTSLDDVAKSDFYPKQSSFMPDDFNPASETREFTVKVQCNVLDKLMIYDQTRSFQLRNIENRKLLRLCRKHGITGMAGRQGGLKFYLSALREGGDILIFTDKVVAEPSWATTKELSEAEIWAAHHNNAETSRYKNAVLALPEEDQHILVGIMTKMQEDVAKNGEAGKASQEKWAAFLEKHRIEMPVTVTPEAYAAARKQAHDEL
jgi:hypothetical protein